MVLEMLARHMYESRDQVELAASRGKTRLLVYDVPDSLTEETFIALFSIYGDVKSARIRRGPRGSCGLGVVDYSTAGAAKAARQGLDGFLLQDAKIRVLQADAVSQDWKLAPKTVDGGVNHPWSPRETQGKCKPWGVLTQDEGNEKEAFAFPDTTIPSVADATIPNVADATIPSVADANGKGSEYASNRKSPPSQVQQSATSFHDSFSIPSKRVSLTPVSASAPPAFVYNNKVQYLLVPNVYPVYPPPNFGLVSRPSSGHVFYAVPLYTNVMLPRVGVWPRLPHNVSVASTPRGPWPPMYPVSMCGNMRSRLPGWVASAVPV